MAFQTGLENKPWWWGFAIGVPVAAGILFLGSWQLWGPKKEEIARQEKMLAGLHTQIQEGRAAKAKLPQFREEVRRLELELDKLLRILPARRNTEDLLRRIRSLMEQGDFDLKRFTPGNLYDKEFYSEWPIAISLDGSYHNLALFFDRIGRFSRIINIDDLSIVALQNQSRYTITASFRAKTFVYKEETPEEEAAREKAAAKAAAKKSPPPRRKPAGGGGGE